MENEKLFVLVDVLKTVGRLDDEGFRKKISSLVKEEIIQLLVNETAPTAPAALAALAALAAKEIASTAKETAPAAKESAPTAPTALAAKETAPTAATVKRQPTTLQAVERKKEKEKKETPAPPASPAPSETPASLVFEIRPPGAGLDPRLGTIDFVETLSDELIDKFNISPILLANSVGKRGNHPFYRGSAAYIWYLPKERRTHYLSGLFSYEVEYPKVGDLIGFDENREKWEEAGIDIDFVSSVLTDGENPVFRNEPQKNEDPSIVERVRNFGGFAKMTQSLGETAGPKLVRFMCRFGIDRQVLEDLLHILEKHKEEPNVYIV